MYRIYKTARRIACNNVKYEQIHANKRKFVLPVLWCGSFGSKLQIWAVWRILRSLLTTHIIIMKGWKLSLLRRRSFAWRAKGTSAKEASGNSNSPKFEQFQRRGNFRPENPIVQLSNWATCKRKVWGIFSYCWKIHPNGPELALEQKRVTKNFKPSKCVATRSCAEGNLLFPSLFLIGYN